MGSEQNPMTSDQPMEDGRSTSQIESDIRRTRDQLDETIDRLTDRLSPRSLINDFLMWFESSGAQQAGGESGVWLKRGYRSVTQLIKENPVPTLFIGAGITWMIVQPEKNLSSDSRTDRVYSEDDLSHSTGTGDPGPISFEQGDLGSAMKEKAAQTKEAFSSAKEAVADKVSNIGSRLETTAASAGSAIGEGVSRSRRAGSKASQQFQKGYVYAGDRFKEAVEEYPLGLAFGFLGLGILTGLLLPRTRQEDKLMGEKSDQLLERAKEAGKETMEKAKTVAQRVADTSIQESKRQAKEAAKDQVSDIADRIGAIANKGKEEAVRAAEEEGLKPGVIPGPSNKAGE